MLSVSPFCSAEGLPVTPHHPCGSTGFSCGRPASSMSKSGSKTVLPCAPRNCGCALIHSARLLLLRIGHEPGFEIAHDVWMVDRRRCSARRGPSTRSNSSVFPGQRRHLDELPVALADGAADGLDVDQDVVVGRWLSLRQRRPHVLAVEGMVRAALAAGEREQRRHHVRPCAAARSRSRGSSLPGQLTMVGTRTPPSCSEPLPPRSLPFEAGGFSPSATPPLSLRSSSDRAPVAKRALVAPPLSLAEDDDRVVAHALLLERGHDAADLIVQPADHRRIGAALLVLDRWIAVDAGPAAPDRGRAGRATRRRGTTAWRDRGSSMRRTASSPISVVK